MGRSITFENVYDLYFQKIYNYVYFRVRHREDVEDVVSIVFYKALSKFDKFTGEDEKILAWLYVIARNEVISFYRSKNKDSFVSLNDNIVSDFDVESIILTYDTEKSIMEALNKVTKEQQDALILYFIQGLKMKEVASILGKSEGAIKSLIYRGLRNMRKLIDKEYGVSYYVDECKSVKV